jgi:hypothetical protein
MKALGRLLLITGLLVVAASVGWWIDRQIKVDTCLDAGHVFDWRNGKCNRTAQRLPGPTQWYDRLF